MMRKMTIKFEDLSIIIRSHKAELDKQRVKNIAIFGSVARGTSSPNSDVDILVDFNHAVGLFEFIRLKMLLEELLDRPVDLITRDALHPALRDRILDEAIYVR